RRSRLNAQGALPARPMTRSNGFARSIDYPERGESMRPFRRPAPGLYPTRLSRWVPGALLLLGICSIGQAPAQLPAPTPAPLPPPSPLAAAPLPAPLFTCPLPLAPLPEKPRPATGPDSLGAFVDNLSRNDSTFEVYLSQGRVLTLKEDLTRGKGEALVAVGDP